MGFAVGGRGGGEEFIDYILKMLVCYETWRIDLGILILFGYKEITDTYVQMLYFEEIANRKTQLLDSAYTRT